MLDELYRVLEKLKDLPEKEQKELLKYFEKIAEEPTFKEIVKNIFSIKDETIVVNRTRQNTLQRLNRFTLSAKTPHEFHQVKKKNYMPILNEGELMEIRFSGLGSETDECHYAIIWKAERQRDTIVIIPTTSFKESSTLETGTTFNIGNISFMGKKTVVMLDQVTTISRKRIDRKTMYKTRRKDPQTQKYEYAKITKAQENRIKDGFRVHHLNESTISSYLFTAVTDVLPFLNSYEEQLDHLHRPYIKNIEQSNDNQFVYALYEDPEKFYTIYLFPIRSGSRKRQLLKAWVEAIAFTNTDGSIAKNRTTVQQEAYDTIQKSMILSSPLHLESPIKK